MTETAKLRSDLSSITYSLLLKDDLDYKTGHYDGESDYSAAVEETFSKFRRETATDYQLKVPIRDGMNHIQAEILDGVALLYRDAFLAHSMNLVQRMQIISTKRSRALIARSISTLLTSRTSTSSWAPAGLTFCLPVLSRTSKEIGARDAFDIALGGKLIRENAAVVLNDFSLVGSERVFVVSGPNQGGKTTFARMFGQLHYLACLGCPVPGKEARLFLPHSTNLFAHFEREENITNLRGKLHDDLVRIRQILDVRHPTVSSS